MKSFMKSLSATAFAVAFVIFASSHSMQAKVISPEQYAEMIKNYSNDELKQEFLRTNYALKTPTPAHLKEDIEEGLEPGLVMAQSFEYKRALFRAVRKEMRHRGLLPRKPTQGAVEPIDPDLVEPLMP